jgi:hypothetical protein
MYCAELNTDLETGHPVLFPARESTKWSDMSTSYLRAPGYAGLIMTERPNSGEVMGQVLWFC